MPQTLCFNEFTFSPVTRDNRPWIPARQLATAPGYKDERSVHKIYERNKASRGFSFTGRSAPQRFSSRSFLPYQKAPAASQRPGLLA